MALPLGLCVWEGVEVGCWDGGKGQVPGWGGGSRWPLKVKASRAGERART